MVERSIKIPNKTEFTFDLELDDIIGIIRLTKHRSKADYIRITDRHIPIDTSTKWQFHKERTGYNEIISKEYNFIGSYIDRNKSPNLYKVWKTYIIQKYKYLKETYKNETNN